MKLYSIFPLLPLSNTHTFKLTTICSCKQCFHSDGATTTHVTIDSPIRTPLTFTHTLGFLHFFSLTVFSPVPRPKSTKNYIAGNLSFIGPQIERTQCPHVASQRTEAVNAEFRLRAPKKFVCVVGGELVTLVRMLFVCTVLLLAMKRHWRWWLWATGPKYKAAV